MSEKSSFRKIFILFSSQTLAQFLPLLAAPFISRLFGPEDFGMLALIISLCEFIGTTSTLRLEMAVPATDNYREAILIALVSFIFSIAFSLLSLIVLLTLYIFNITPSLPLWIIVTSPVISIIIGFGITLNYFNLKHQRYTGIAIANISRSASQTATQITFGLIGLTKIGLVIGYIISSMLYTINLSILFFKEYRKTSKIESQELLLVLKKYKKFPLFSFWASFLNIISLNSVVFFLNHFFNKIEVGYYSFAVKYINAPLNIIGNSISNVFFEESSKQAKDKSGFKRLYFKNLKILTISSIFIFLPVYFFSEELFPMVFGENWKIAGTVVKVMTPLLAIRYISNPLSFSLLTLGKQKVELTLQISFLILNIFIWLIIYHFSLSFIVAVQFYSITLSLHYLFVIIYINFIVQKFAKTN